MQVQVVVVGEFVQVVEVNGFYQCGGIGIDVVVVDVDCIWYVGFVVVDVGDQVQQLQCVLYCCCMCWVQYEWGIGYGDGFYYFWVVVEGVDQLGYVGICCEVVVDEVEVGNLVFVESSYGVFGQVWVCVRVWGVLVGGCRVCVVVI